jgi:emp24/gp25L/p24 family/GOLD
VQVEDESRSALLPQKAGTTPEQTSALEDTIFKISSQLSTISRMQKYFRTRENRNFSTVRSTERRIFNFSLVEVGMMVGMAALQVLVVRFFFQGARKGESFSTIFYDVEEDCADQICRVRLSRASGAAGQSCCCIHQCQPSICL